MTTFRCKADFTFQAEDIDTALTKVSKHLEDVKEGRDSQLIELGSIWKKPLEETNDTQS